MFDLRAHTHLLTVAGSRAYGIHRPASDVDLKGFAIPPAAELLGLRKGFEVADAPEQMEAFRDLLSADELAACARTKLEGSVFELRKLARLALDCNPHVLDLLFCREEEVRLASPIGRAFRAERARVLSQRARYAFGGYAVSQLKRIQTHRRWLLEPPTRKPERADFDLPEVPEIPREQRLAAEAVVRKQLEHWEPDLSSLEPSEALRLRDLLVETFVEMRLTEDERYRLAARRSGLADGLVHQLLQERAYSSAMQQFKQYQTWKRRRNPERAALEEAHGYDTKHGAHLVRLLSMALEVVETGQVNVWRGDRDGEELLAIREGAWSYERLLDWTETQEARLDAATKTTALPAQPDREGMETLVVEWIATVLRERG